MAKTVPVAVHPPFTVTEHTHPSSIGTLLEVYPSKIPSFHLSDKKMLEGRHTEKILNSLVEVADNVSKQKSVSFFDDNKTKSVTAQFNRLFGRRKPVYHLLGGGKSADVLLWRNKKISAGVLTAATAIWILFEWLNYHLLTFVCYALVLGMLSQFLWSNASFLPTSKSSEQVPRLFLPRDLFVNIGISVGSEANQALEYLQDVACGGSLKQFLIVVASLWLFAVIGSWCNFLTVLYIGFVAAHTLPVLYERYEDEVDSFAYKFTGQVQSHYQKVEIGLLSKIPKGKFKEKKFE